MKSKALNEQSLIRAAKKLAKIDPALQRVLKANGPPPLWKRPATFATFVRIILEQQVSLSSARSTFNRLKDVCDGPVVPTAIESLGEDGLRNVGFTRQKTRYTLALASDVIDGKFRIGSLRHRDDDEVRELIKARLGMGDWTADVFLLMALCRADVFPVGDLALVKGMAELDGVVNGPHQMLSEQQVLERAEKWRPYRSVASRMIWQLYLSNRNQTA